MVLDSIILPEVFELRVPYALLQISDLFVEESLSQAVYDVLAEAIEQCIDAEAANETHERLVHLRAASLDRVKDFFHFLEH